MEQIKRKRLRRAALVLVLLLILAIPAGYFIYHRYFDSFARFNRTDDYPPMPDVPEAGIWYQLDVPGTVSADDEHWHGDIRLGTENKVIVYFFGGGIAFDNYTTAHSYSVAEDDGFYFDTEGWILDYMASRGMGDSEPDNPFRDWTIIAIPYTTGDMHIGSGDWTCVTDSGKEKTIHFRGYDNYRAMMEASMPYVGQPDTLLICGTSAGGFGAALLAEDVMGYFPEAENITVCVDSAFLLLDQWPEVARDMWQAPPEIAARITTNNIMLDPLVHLYETCGDRVKILYDCSVQDAELSRFQSYIDRGQGMQDNLAGQTLQRDMRDMVPLIQAEIPTAGLLFWDGLPFSDDPENTLTRHTLLVSTRSREPIAGDKSILDWVYDAVQGNVWSYGIEKLDRKYG